MLPILAVPIVGACGVVVAVIALVAALLALVADALVDVSANVYEVADCNPVTVIGDVPLAVNDPGVDVAVNVSAAPPVAAAV